jgi:hypothetical protein
LNGVQKKTDNCNEVILITDCKNRYHFHSRLAN